MPAKVTLTITAGPEVGRQYIFAGRTTALIGRDGECHIRFPKDREHQTVSRFHCLLDINPPEVRIRDLGSRSGTRINGQLIGKRDKAQSPEEGFKAQFAEFTLRHGDQIKVGKIVLGVDIVQPVLCGECGTEIPASEAASLRLADGAYSCAQCRSTAALPVTVTHQPHYSADFEPMAQRLLALANTGTRELQPISGYQLGRELGRGGMGAVYLAVHEETGKCVALKMMLPQVAPTKRMRDLFLREAGNMKVLDHRNVVRLHDLGCSEGTFFFTLEYCEGGSVADLLKQRGKLPADKAVALVRQALDGLHYAHQVELPAVPLAGGGAIPARGLVHRDIKPHNLFLTKQVSKYIVKIGDYGLAKAFDLAGLSGLSMTGATAGTPLFMPRQQVIDYCNARPEVDVWAMAASLYYMLTLHYPRDFHQDMDPWQVVLRTDAVPIRQRDASLPAKLVEVIDTALIDQPEIIFKTAAAFRTALEGALS